jgi:tight adherence protein B
MKIMPFGILAYIGVSYPGYFDSLYHNFKGITIMTVSLLIYVAAFVAGDRILHRIELEMM